MTLKIDKRAERHGTTIKLIGQIQLADLGGLKAELQHSEPMIILDLEEAFLVDVDATRFLAECDIQESTIVRFNVRDWIARERKEVNTPVASGAKPASVTGAPLEVTRRQAQPSPPT